MLTTRLRLAPCYNKLGLFPLLCGRGVMLKLLQCRRTFLAFSGIICLTFIGYTKNIDVSMAIMGIVTAVAAANATQKSNEAKFNGEQK